MPKVKISDFNSNPALNTDIDSINLAEGCAPSGINDAIRELMSQLKDWQSGTSNDPMVIGSSGSLTLNQGTANGVAYLNGSKVVTSGSALTFDGTSLATTGGFTLSGRIGFTGFSTDVDNFGLWVSSATSATTLASYSTNPIAFRVNGSEQMRLTSTGLGIGTSSLAGLKLVALGATGYPATSGTTQTGVLRLSGGTGLYNVLDMGVNESTDTSWMQATRANSLGTYDKLVINPYGGNVGIGTSSPVSKLHVRGATNGNLLVRGGASAASGLTGTALSSINDAASATVSLNFEGSDFNFVQSNAVKATLDANGNLLVGTTTASAKLTLQQNSTNDVIRTNIGTSGSGYVVIGSGSTMGAAYFQTSSGFAGQITCSGTTTSYATSSDYRLKNTVAPMAGALAKVAQLKPCTYKWNSDGSDGEGFIAHELAEVVPQCVTGEKDAVDENGNPKYQGIDTSFLVATLTAAIQELKAEFDAYKASHP